MPRSCSHIYLHVVFATKGRSPLIQRALWPELAEVFGGELRKRGCELIVANGAEDHAHLLWRHSRDAAPSMCVLDIKRASSKWMKKRAPGLEPFYWQEGYGMFSIGLSGLGAARRYIERQEARHRSESFDAELDEFRRIYGSDGFDF